MSDPVAPPTPKGLTSTYRKTSLHLDPVQQRRALDLYPLLTISEIARMAIDLVIELRPVCKPPRFVLRCETVLDVSPDGLADLEPEEELRFQTSLKTALVECDIRYPITEEDDISYREPFIEPEG